MNTFSVKTKVICTIGPASSSKERLRQLLAKGMDVARLNFSHGSHELHSRTIKTIRELSMEMNIHPGIHGDLQGFKIRTGPLKSNEPVVLRPGSPFTLCSERFHGDAEGMSVDYSELPANVSAGSSIFIRDGLIELKVLSVDEDEVFCEVVHGGRLKGRDGVNVPGLVVKGETLTDKDLADTRFAVEQDIDFLGVSFVRTATDLVRVKDIVEGHGSPGCKLIAKVETREAVDNISEILEYCHGIMIARGDLGVELLPETVPTIQKDLISLCNRRRKLVITATQMLESMTENPRPTRAEASDVANAVFDGSDALLLSGETAVGNYPVESLVTMKKIAREAEQALQRRKRQFFERKYDLAYHAPDAICHSAAYAANQLKAKAIVVLTRTGYTGFLISKYHPGVPILGITPHPATARRLSVYRGVTPMIGEMVFGFNHIKLMVDRCLKKGGHAKRGDTVIVISGTPVKDDESVDRTSNMLMIHSVK